MISLELTPEDYRQIRFASSPLAEVVASLRLLGAGRPGGLHARWLGWLRTSGIAHRVDLHLLTTLVRPQGYVPDFLSPVPPGRTVGFAEAIAQLAATPSDVVRHELGHLATHEVAQRGPGRAEREGLLRRLCGDPDGALSRIGAELERYWEVALAPHWQRIHALHQADLAHRLDELATGGVDRLFGDLHPAVAFRGEVLTVVKYYEARLQLRGRGLLLVPCAFAWPDVLVSTADPMPSLTYSPRGLGTLWEKAPPSNGAPLAAVVGSARATILELLDLPMSTTALAGQLRLAAPTVSVHLKALTDAGILDRRREGRTVLYQRTDLGDHLLDPAR